MSSLVSGVKDIVTQGAQSALAALAGNTLRADDDLFVAQSVYFFELRLPNSSNPTSVTRYRFPLALNPEAISFSEPFMAESTPTLGGGLVVEESGIVQRSIRIRGSTGTYQRSMKDADIGQLNTLGSDQRTFGRVLDPVIQGILSGQKIFQYLQDSVFRVYADAKRDPSMAAGTALIFQMPRESEAWEVVPTHFGYDRSAGRPLDYPYDIELMVVQKAELTLLPFSEDKPVLDALKDPLKVAANFLGRATAAVQALAAAQGQLRNYFRSLDVILVQASALVTSVSEFVQGSANLISAPASTVRVLASTIASSLEAFVAAEESLKAVPQTYEQSMRQLEGACYYLLLHPASFAQARAAATQAEQATAEFLNAQAAAALASRTSSLPTTLSAASRLGTSLTPEQAVQIQTDVQAGGSTIQYTGSHSYQVRAGDTFSNLAGRFLGDARRWRYIAALNNIKPPYNQMVGSTPLLAQGQPVTLNGLKLGDTILIPDFSTPQSGQTDLTTLGVSPDAPVQDRLFGTDLALAVGGGLATNTRALAQGQKLDWVVDASSGNTDLKSASGLDNLAQAVLTRVSLERGQDPLYQSLGVDPVVGSSIAAIDAQTLAFNLREALTQDPRIAQVLSLSVQRSSGGDGLMLQGSLQARGFSEPVPLTLPLSGAQTG